MFYIRDSSIFNFDFIVLSAWSFMNHLESKWDEDFVFAVCGSLIVSVSPLVAAVAAVVSTSAWVSVVVLVAAIVGEEAWVVVCEL